jgi:hypothetical protein
LITIENYKKNVNDLLLSISFGRDENGSERIGYCGYK